MEGLKTSGRCHCFVIVNSFSLGKAFCYILDFVVDNLPSVVVFAFAYELTLQGSFPLW